MPILDLIIIVIYLLGIMALGLWSGRKMKFSSQQYFLADRSLKWGVIGMALFASNISTIHLIGLAASGYQEGLVWGNFEWMAIFALILLSLVFGPFYFSQKITTLPEFLERRYNAAARTCLAVISIMGALFIHIGISLYAGATVFEQFFGIELWTSIIIISIITGIYTIIGGLKAVVVTEAVQTVILLLGAITITGFGIWELTHHGIHSIADLKAAVKPGQLSMIHDSETSSLPWYAILLGYPVLGVWYWCTDQTIVQRVLGAETLRDAQIGPLFAGVLKILPVFFMVFPGVLAYVLFQDIIGADSNQALPVMISQLIPTGLKGIIAAGLLAALMSTIAAALNSSATLVSFDVVKRVWPNVSDVLQVRTGKIVAIIVMLLAMLWSTQGGKFSSIFAAINSVAANLAPPITTVFLFGVFWKRGTAKAALITLIFGFCLGAAAFILDLPVFGDEKIITEGWGIPFMMQAWWSFCICSLVFVISSLLSSRSPAEKARESEWSNSYGIKITAPLKGRYDPRILATALIGVMIILYIIFR